MALVRQQRSPGLGGSPAMPGGSMEPTRHGAQGQTALLTRPADAVHVSVCGRTVTVALKDARTLVDLKGTLQRELKMQGQDFSVCDSMNAMLVTDGDLVECISKGNVPLSASLSEAAIHYIENRREELAQMQWKLLRDKVETLTQKMNVFDQQLRHFGDSLGGHQVHHEEVTRRLQGDLDSRIEEAKEHGRGLGGQLAERLEAVSQIVHSERNLREAMKEGMMRQMQATREALEGDRGTRRAEVASTNAVLEELRRSLRDESAVREDMFGRQHREMESLLERVDMLSRQQTETKQDMEAYVKDLTMDASSELAGNNRSVIQLRTAMESAEVEANARFQKLEDRAMSLENRIRENANRHSTQLNQLWGKTHGLSSTLEEVRIKDRGEKLERERNAKARPDDPPSPEPSVAAGRTSTASMAAPVGSMVAPMGAISVAGSHVSAPYGSVPPQVSGLYRRPSTPASRPSSVTGSTIHGGGSIVLQNSGMPVAAGYPVATAVARYPNQH